MLGGGPAGLGAAWRLSRRGCFDISVIERSLFVGGNAGSFDLAGHRVDYGSHRLHPACSPEVLADIQDMLGEQLLNRPRHGRIRLRGRWVHFPLKPLDLLVHLPPSFVVGVGRDLLSKLGRTPAENSFQALLEKGLGKTICSDFYFPYARKIWGIPPDELDAEQARRRVSASSLPKMARKVLNAVPGLKPRASGRFYYPRGGYGAISEAYCRAAMEAGAAVHLGMTVTGIETENGRAAAVRAQDSSGEIRFRANHILSTIPLSSLPCLIEPSAPTAILESSRALKFRAMLLIYLVLETVQFTEFDAHYFPGPEIAITRLSEPKNYSLNGPAGSTVLCAELPCFPEDAVWSAPDAELGALVAEALAAAGLPIRVPIREVAVRRLKQAYPVYTRNYREHFDRIDGWVNSFEGILTFGRQGLFAHDNTHHALAMAYAADSCLDDSGNLNRVRWAEHRRAFEHHVVED